MRIEKEDIGNRIGRKGNVFGSTFSFINWKNVIDSA